MSQKQRPYEIEIYAQKVDLNYLEYGPNHDNLLLLFLFMSSTSNKALFMLCFSA